MYLVGGNMKRTIKLFVLLTLCICLFGCAKQNENVKPNINSEEKEEQMEETQVDDGIIRIGFIGDSVTQGYLTPNPLYDAYPGQLQSMLGEGYEIMNFGFGGACTISDKDDLNVYSKKEKYYKNTEMYKLSLDYDADIVVIMLGTNDRVNIYPDSCVVNNEAVESFKYWMEDLCEVYKEKGAKVYIASSTYAPIDKKPAHEFFDGILQKYQKEFAEEYGYEYIDVWSISRKELENKDNFAKDCLHPNVDGQRIIAEAFKKINDEDNIFDIK